MPGPEGGERNRAAPSSTTDSPAALGKPPRSVVTTDQTLITCFQQSQGLTGAIAALVLSLRSLLVKSGTAWEQGGAPHAVQSPSPPAQKASCVLIPFSTLLMLLGGGNEAAGAARAPPAPANGSRPARPYPDLSSAGARLMHFHRALWLYSTFSPAGLRSGGDRRRQGVRMRPPAAGRVLSCLQPGSAWSRGESGDGVGAARLPLLLQLPRSVPAARCWRCPPLCQKHPKVLPGEAPILPPCSRDANPQFLWIKQGSTLGFPPAGPDPLDQHPSLPGTAAGMLWWPWGY